jgi:hypothetical protein
MSTKIVNVSLNTNGTELTLDPLVIELQGGDAVQWNFQNVPAGLPFIHFDGSPLGPFEKLELSGSSVVGSGNSGMVGEHPYTAFVLGSQEAVVISAGQNASIDNHSDVEISSTSLVSFVPDPESFTVSPATISVQKGHTAIWCIVGVPAGLFVTFHFDLPADPLNGPFVSFSVSHAGNVWLAKGVGFLEEEPGDQDPITYHVRLRDAQGHVVHETDPDPVIDRLGSPPQ